MNIPKKSVGRPSKNSAEVLDKAFEVYMTTGMGVRRIAALLGIHTNHVSYYIRKRLKEAQSEQNVDKDFC